MVTNMNENTAGPATAAPPASTETGGGLAAMRTRSDWRLALTMAVVAAALYQLFVSGMLDGFIQDRSSGALLPLISGIATGFLVLVCGAIPAVYHPRSTWRWGATVALAPVTVVILRIMFDAAFIDPRLHHLFPLEIAMVLFMTVPSAFIGASIGSIIGKSMKRLEA